MEEQIISLPHGGDWAGFAAECGALPLDFSASVSPLGLPEGVRDAAAQALREADRYPDPLCRALRRAIAAEEEVEEEMVLCGCGAADLIWRVVWARRPRRTLVLAPTFSEYESALRAAGCVVVHSALRRDAGFTAGCPNAGAGHGLFLPAQQPHWPSPAPGAAGSGAGALCPGRYFRCGG